MHDPNFNRFRLIQCDSVTDGQTDGRTDGRAMAYTRYSIYAVARKNEKKNERMSGESYILMETE